MVPAKNEEETLKAPSGLADGIRKARGFGLSDH